MQRISRSAAALLLVLVMLCSLFGCNQQEPIELSSLKITNCERAELVIGETLQLETDAPREAVALLEWSASNASVTVSSKGLVRAVEEGTVAVSVSYGDCKDTVLITVVAERAGGNDQPSDGEITYPDSDIPVDEEARAAFYVGSDPADSHAEALERSARGELSGAETVPDQAPTLAPDQPTAGGVLIRNSQPYYPDANTYVVVNTEGEEVFRVYRGGGYITLEEVAAYLYAFGDVPANYIEGKKKDPQNSIWGEHLRLNHSKFSGDTDRYPYEPVLPRISGCGGDLYYYEVDIGTTGTTCDPGYMAAIYNDGYNITRGAARIVYTRYDANKNSIIDPNEKYLFYTYNHYNDFQEYLNYYGGWGEMFGNITGGGTLSSKYDYNPTDYVPSVLAPLTKDLREVRVPETATVITFYAILPKFRLPMAA